MVKNIKITKFISIMSGARQKTHECYGQQHDFNSVLCQHHTIRLFGITLKPEIFARIKF